MYIDESIYRSYGSTQRALATHDRTYISVEPNRSVKPSFMKKDYTSFRASEGVPARQKAVISMCMDAYDNVGIIKNIIDLMGDFACQGMTIVHKSKAEEKFYRKWFEEINGQERSERFLNYLYRMGNVVVRRGLAKISPKQVTKFKAVAKGKPFDEPKFKEREIPWAYEFLNPLVVDYKIENGVKPRLYMNLSEPDYAKLIANSSTPEDIRKVLNRNKKAQIPLDEKNIRVFHYKKDDWLLWANPMIRPILDDIIMLEKMKLADLAALDGVVSNITLWTLGDLEHKIMPKKAAVDKLRDILASNTGGGPMNLIWGPDLKFQESATQVHKFLGEAKYQPVLTSIYAGLGVPSSLTGSSASGGFTNNYVSLKTLIERLEYGRQILLSFWAHEFKLVQLAMGFKTSPNIHFDNIILSDEAAVNTLLVNLADRDIISNETLLERLGELPEIEQIRIQRENVARKNVEAPNKAGPFHNPQHTEDMAKLALTNQVLNVKEYFDQLGIPSQKPPVIPAATPGGGRTQRAKPKKPSGGRPVGVNDSTKRKQKRVLPRANADTLSVWAINAQREISEIISPIALSYFVKKNVRSLTRSEVDQLEHLKLCAFAGLEPFSDITEKSVKSIIESVLSPPKEFMTTVNFYKTDFITKCQKEPSLDDLRFIYAIAYTDFYQNKS